MKTRCRLSTLAAFAVVTLSGCTSEAPIEFGEPSQALAAPPQAFIPPPPFAAAPTTDAAATEFHGKFVGINYVVGDESMATVLFSPTVKKLGERSFLVGEIVSGDVKSKSKKKSATTWVPLESIDSLMAFESKDQALDDVIAPDGEKM